MVKYWIFVSVPYTDFNTGSIDEILDKIKSSKTWPIGRRTVYRNLLSKGDRVLLYQGGEQGKKIVGSADLNSGLIGKPDGICDGVLISNLDLWKEPVDIKKVVSKLSFVRNPERWGFYFKGGVVRISERDYKEILRRHSGERTTPKIERST
jgi:hypothetical protein